MVNHFETDAQYIARIKSMDSLQLVEEIVTEPTYLTDPYYSWFGEAMRERAAQLRTERDEQLIALVKETIPSFGVHEMPAEMVPQLYAADCAHDIEARARLDDADARRPPSTATLREKLGIR